MTFPFLSVIVFTPAAASMIILLVPAQKKNLARAMALSAAVLDLALSLTVYLTYLTQHLTGYQFIQQIPLAAGVRHHLHFGVDGMSLPLILLTGVVMFTGVLISWGEDKRHVQAASRTDRASSSRSCSSWPAACSACSLARPFQLFFFYEIAVFPMYLLIVIWGWMQTREYAAMKLTLYLFIGSVVALVGALAMYWLAPTGNLKLLPFDMLSSLEKATGTFLARLPDCLVPARVLRLRGAGWHLALP